MSERTFFLDRRESRLYFWRVIEGYRAISQLSPIVAINIDPFATPTKLDISGIHYVADVALATKHALNNEQGLLNRWQQLVDGEADVPNANDVIHQCGREYARRRLAPSSYLHSSRVTADGFGINETAEINVEVEVSSLPEL